MLDSDLAESYGVKAIRLRERVRQNIDKSPSLFMFQLTEDEVDIMVSQNAIPSKQQISGALPLAFAEHGVLMLSNVIKSKLATKVSIRLNGLFFINLIVVGVCRVINQWLSSRQQTYPSACFLAHKYKRLL